MAWFSDKVKYTYTPYSMPLFQTDDIDTGDMVKKSVLTSVIQNRNISTNLIRDCRQCSIGQLNMIYSLHSTKNHPWGLPTDSYLSLKESDGYIDKVYLVANTFNEKDRLVKDLCGHINVALSDIEQVRFTWLGKYDITCNSSGQWVTRGYWYIYIEWDDGDWWDPNQSKGAWQGEWSMKFNLNTGSYPTLVPESQGAVLKISPYYPIIPIRMDNQMTTDESHPDYPWVKKSFKHLGLDMEALAEQIEDASKESGENPCEDMFLVPAISITDPLDMCVEYIARYFTHMVDAINEPQGGSINGVVTIEDRRYKQQLAWKKVNVTRTTEKKPPYLKRVGYSIEVGAYFKNRFHRVIVEDLECAYYVVGKAWVSIDLIHAFNNPESEDAGKCFLIPLRRDVLNSMGAVKADLLAVRGIRLFNNDEYSYKIKWYQQGFFKVFILVVATVVNFLTVGTSTPITAAVIAATFAEILLITVVTQVVFKIATPLLGAELASVLSSITGMVLGGSDLTGLGSVLQAGLIVANNLMKLTYKGKIEDINAQLLKVDQALAEVEEDMDALLSSDGTALDIYKEMYNTVQYREITPTAFINNTLNSGKNLINVVDNYKHFVSLNTHLDLPETFLKLGHC